MKTLTANLINALIILTFVSAFFSIRVTTFFLLSLILVTVLSLFLHGFRNKKIYILIGLSMVSILLIAIFGSQDVKPNQNSQSVENINKESVDNVLQNFEIKVKNNEDRGSLIEYYQYMVIVATQKLSKDNSISYLNLAKVYEAGYVTGLLADQNYVLNGYYEYCKLEPNEPECYASIARFLALDKKNKDEALKFANRALDLAKSESDIAKYNSLVEYIIKL